MVATLARMLLGKQKRRIATIMPVLLTVLGAGGHGLSAPRHAVVESSLERSQSRSWLRTVVQKPPARLHTVKVRSVAATRTHALWIVLESGQTGGVALLFVMVVFSSGHTV